MGKQVPIVDYLVIDDGEPYLVANESTESGALYFDRRNADAKSGKPGFEQRKLEPWTRVVGVARKVVFAAPAHGAIFAERHQSVGLRH